MRLEALGFPHVFDYAGGKKDWLAEGMDVEGDRADEARAGSIARTDPPTCRPDEPIGQLRDREDIETWGQCVVTDNEGTVHGVLRYDAVAPANPAEPVSLHMELAPVTIRPDASIAETQTYLEERSLQSILVTTSRGRLLGVLIYHDVHVHLEATASTS